MADDTASRNDPGSLEDLLDQVDRHLNAADNELKAAQDLVRRVREASAPPEPLIIAALLKVTEELVSKRAGSDPRKLCDNLVVLLQNDSAHEDVAEGTIRRAAEEAVPLEEDDSFNLETVERNVELLAYALAKAGVVSADRIDRLPGYHSDAFSTDTAKDAIKRGADRAATEKRS